MAAAHYREWLWCQNPRTFCYSYCLGEHVTLEELKDDPDVDNYYLNQRNIPAHPQSVLFKVSYMSHVTGESGLQGIFKDGGFRGSDENLLWWSLTVTKDDIAAAEKRFLKTLFPRFSENQPQAFFLEKFTTSPAFQSNSRYGNFRFTFSIRDLLSLYGSQFCCKSSLVLRVFNTQLYKQEIVYSILVHPSYIQDYNHLPRLPSDDQSVCAYSQGETLWHCQAPADALNWILEVDGGKQEVRTTPLWHESYFVWDHVAWAFHMEPDWTLHVDSVKLLQSLSVCELSKITLLKKPDVPLTKAQAEARLESLKCSR